MAAPTVHVSLTALDAPLLVRRNINVEGARVRRKVAYNHTIPFTSSATNDTHMMLRMNSCDRIVALLRWRADGGDGEGDVFVSWSPDERTLQQHWPAVGEP